MSRVHRAQLRVGYARHCLFGKCLGRRIRDRARGSFALGVPFVGAPPTPPRLFAREWWSAAPREGLDTLANEVNLGDSCIIANARTCALRETLRTGLIVVVPRVNLSRPKNNGPSRGKGKGKEGGDCVSRNRETDVAVNPHFQARHAKVTAIYRWLSCVVNGRPAGR